MLMIICCTSNTCLTTIPTGLLQPLQHLTKVPAISLPPVTEDVYDSLQPFLRVFLAGNALRHLPSELFALTSLKVLSLRNNELSSIPSAVLNLTMLQELNVAVNRLQELPWELLRLIQKGDLKHLTVLPNPLVSIDESQVEIAKWHYYYHQNQQEGEEEERDTRLKLFGYEGPAPEEAWAPIHIATGPVQYITMEGFPVPVPKSPSRVPSLRETCLLTLSSKSQFLDQTSPAEIMQSYPSLIARLLLQARETRCNAGSRSCSMCHRGYVVPRSTWVEWWDCSTYENGLKMPRASGEVLRPLPFRRFGCSWLCVPRDHHEEAAAV